MIFLRETIDRDLVDSVVSAVVHALFYKVFSTTPDPENPRRSAVLLS
jgi:hypothetical protein